MKSPQEIYARQYYDRVYQVSLDQYQKVLEYEVFQHFSHLEGCSVLDIACGPGQWSLAAAKINKRLKVVGIDINEYSLALARKEADKNNIRNAEFRKMTAEDLLLHFAPASFDVILINGVLMFLDEKKTLGTISRLLKNNGVLLSMWNHHFGYYLRKLVNNLYLGKLGGILFAANAVFRNPIRNYILNETVREKPIFYNYIKRIGQRYGLKIKIVKLIPRLDYHEKYLLFPDIWNFKMIKRF